MVACGPKEGTSSSGGTEAASVPVVDGRKAVEAVEDSRA
jgi:hypothetical protein